jgi:integrase
MKIIKKGRLYWLDIRIGGKRHRVSLETDEYPLALARARDKAAELEAGPAAGPGLTFADFAPRYLTWAKDTKPGSYRTERGQIEEAHRWLDGQGLLRLAQVTPYHVEQFRSHVRARDRRGKPAKDSPPRPATKATANRYCAALRKLYNLAISWGAFTGPNPLSRVRFYRENAKVEPMTAADLGKVLEAARAIAAEPWSPVQRVCADLITFSVHTGARKSEALHVRWRDIRDDAVVFHGKGDKTRTVPINRAALAVIERQPRVGPYVFDVPNRGQMDVLRRTVGRIRKLSGVPHFHFHLTRHYFTSALLAAGVDIETISRLCGHSRVMTTLIYSHSTPERMREAVSALDTKGGHSPSDAKKPKQT